MKTSYVFIFLVLFPVVLMKMRRSRSSGNGCSWYISHKFQGRCYAFFQGELPWQEAQKTCQTLTSRGTLPVYLNNSTIHWLREETFRLFKDYREIWVGANDLQEKGVLRWTDGSLAHVMEFFDVKNLQPDNLGGNERCVNIGRQDPYLSDADCVSKFNYVCQEPG
ncbi:snaclec mamushigin subunit beta-like [Physella acuta]|uniref:snaclec mamushigin subunit beta-like n=1 Tax=Physella acuta TaxID=109671 RepID=UPI0027DE1CD6|nr:snaclec mamushigin subunit beta-like [Physella acuta]